MILYADVTLQVFKEAVQFEQVFKFKISSFKKSTVLKLINLAYESFLNEFQTIHIMQVNPEDFPTNFLFFIFILPRYKQLSKV